MSYARSVVGEVERFEEEPLEPPQVETVGLDADEESSSIAFLRLRDGGIYEIDRSDRRFPLWSGFLRGRESSSEPIYLETDESERRVLRVLPPVFVEIAEVQERPGGEEHVIRALASPAPIFLRAEHPRHDELLERLEVARREGREVLLTDDPETHEVLDVRFSLGANADQGELAAEVVDALAPDRVGEVFGALAGQADIPFDFPRDCCCARAHAMFRLLQGQGIRCRKVWSHGTGGVLNPLRFVTANEPDGVAEWFFHVAPLVQVLHENGPPDDLVLDPAISDHPIGIAEWRGFQIGPAELHIEPDPGIYSRERDGSSVRRDDDFSRTDMILAKHRFYRRLRQTG